MSNLSCKTNKELCETYKFLIPRNRFTDEPDTSYKFTELDIWPKGWRLAFGEKFCKDLKDACIKTNCLDDIRILDCKEKFGYLHIYLNGYNKEIRDVISKYSQLSKHTCINCGKPATKITTGWISPFCDDCIDLVNDSYVNIEDWFDDADN